MRTSPKCDCESLSGKMHRTDCTLNKKQMTDQEINAAIAEKCGWVNCKVDEWGGVSGRRLPDGLERELPNYCTDMNAMREAEMTLRKSPGTYQPGGLGLYLNELDALCDNLVFATACQRAEAFLRTIGKWRDE